MAGRDIGTVVLPDADLKLYLDVSVEERARRRAEERGLADDARAVAQIEDELRRRDGIDSTRETAPLRIPRWRDGHQDRGQHVRRDSRGRSWRPSASASASTLSPVKRASPRSLRASRRACRRLVLPRRRASRREASTNCPQTGPLIVVANHISNARSAARRWLADAGAGQADAHPGQGIAVRRPRRLVPAQQRGHAGQGRRQRHRGVPSRRRRCSTAARCCASSPRARAARPACCRSQSRAWRCWRRALGVPILPVGICGSDRSLAVASACRASARASRCASAQPFTLELDPALSRRAAMAKRVGRAHAPHRGAR